MAVPASEVERVRQWAAEHVPEHVRDRLWVEVEVDAISDARAGHGAHMNMSSHARNDARRYS